jgi:hypothetical protein
MLSSNKQTRSAGKSQKKKAVKVEYCNYEEADSRASIKGRRKGAGAGGQRCKARELQCGRRGVKCRSSAGSVAVSCRLLTRRDGD